MWSRQITRDFSIQDDDDDDDDDDDVDDDDLYTIVILFHATINARISPQKVPEYRTRTTTYLRRAIAGETVENNSLKRINFRVMTKRTRNKK